MHLYKIKFFAGLLGLTLGLSAGVSGMNTGRSRQKIRDLSIKAQAPAAIKILDLASGAVQELNTGREYTQKFRSVFSEDLTMPSNLSLLSIGQLGQVAKLVAKSKYMSKLTKKTRARLAKPFSDVALASVDADLGLGYHLVATNNIPSGTVLFLYAGTVKMFEAFEAKEGRLAQSDYAMDLFRDEQYNGADICPLVKGGLARFMPHLPMAYYTERAFLMHKYSDDDEKAAFIDMFPNYAGLSDESFFDAVTKHNCQGNEEEIQEFEFYDDAKKQLATANVYLETIELDGLPVKIAVTNRAITKGEPIGFSYGRIYWNGRHQNPVPFAKDGGLLNKALYRRTQLGLALKVESRAGENAFVMMDGDQFDGSGLVFRSQLPDGNTLFQSAYVLREEFAANNVMNSDHFAALSPSSFAQGVKDMLRHALPDADISVLSYWQILPHKERKKKPGQTTNYIADTIIRAKTPEDFAKIIAFFERHRAPFELLVGSKKLYELVISGTNALDRARLWHAWLNEYMREINKLAI